MNYSRRAELFRQLRTKHAGYLASVLWKLTHDRELFTEATQFNCTVIDWGDVSALNPKFIEIVKEWINLKEVT